MTTNGVVKLKSSSIANNGPVAGRTTCRESCGADVLI